MTRVKICGITTLADARCAARADADFLGFIFYPRSPRYVDITAVRSIADAIRGEFDARAPLFVGVFVDAPEDTVRATLRQARLDLAQLHGTESPALITTLRPRAFKALRPRTLGEAQASCAEFSVTWDYLVRTAPELLVDAYHVQQMGGTGERADTTIARWLARHCRLMLAGGLTPDNVAGAVSTIRPWGVDVSSGVEAAKGRKDHDLVRAFIAAVRSADETISCQPSALGDEQ